ncbi:3627_t:CDS:2, partial [Acaulospora colombiana]
MAACFGKSGSVVQATTFHSTRRSGQPECLVKRVSEGSPRFWRGGNRMRSTSPTIRLGAKADKEELYEGSCSYTITHGADTSLGRVQREEVPISSDDTNDHAIDYNLPQEVYWAHARMLHSTTPTTLQGTVDARGSATTTANPARMNTTTTMNTTPTTMFTTLAQKNGRMNDCWRGRERSDSSCTSSTVTSDE